MSNNDSAISKIKSALDDLTADHELKSALLTACDYIDAEECVCEYAPQNCHKHKILAKLANSLCSNAADGEENL